MTFYSTGLQWSVEAEHKMKTEVKFPISNPIAFTSEANYERLGVTTCMEAGKLVALKTVVEHDIATGHSDIISEARGRMTALLTLIEYSSGVTPNIGQVQTHAVDPDSGLSNWLQH